VIATNDRIYLGGDILVLAGEVSFTGCVWIYSTWFAGEYGVRADVHACVRVGQMVDRCHDFNQWLLGCARQDRAG